MPYITAIMFQSQNAKAQHPVFAIDGIPISVWLSGFEAAEVHLGSVPAQGWLIDDQEFKWAWERIESVDVGVSTIVPLLVCSDHADLTCSVVVVEQFASSGTITWQRFGRSRTAGFQTGIYTEWLSEIPAQVFPREEFLSALLSFKFLAAESSKSLDIALSSSRVASTYCRSKLIDNLGQLAGVFTKYFSESKNRLKKLGFNPKMVRLGGRVSESDIVLIEKTTNRPMPPELRAFFLEMGDRFTFIPDDSPGSPLYNGWPPISLGDYEQSNKESGLSSEIDVYVSQELESNSSRVNPDLLRQEAERRKAWIPFYGGTDRLCLDAEGKVQFFQAEAWTADCSGFLLAESFLDFFMKCSKYSFVVPEGVSYWDSFCYDKVGVFDWSPSLFPKEAIYHST
jgi:hypothetical protein